MKIIRKKKREDATPEKRKMAEPPKTKNKKKALKPIEMTQEQNKTQCYGMCQSEPKEKRGLFRRILNKLF